MVEHYARQVNQRRLAAAAILKWESADAARAAKDTKGREAKDGGFVQPASEFVQHDRPQTSKLLDSLVPPPRLERGTPRSTIRRSGGTGSCLSVRMKLLIPEIVDVS